jgi:hypothetical protein
MTSAPAIGSILLGSTSPVELRLVSGGPRGRCGAVLGHQCPHLTIMRRPG